MPEVPNATQAEDLDAAYDYLEEQVEEAMELMPWAAYDEIWNLKQNMMLSFTEFVRAEHENKKGRQPEVWKEVIPQFDQINYNMAELLNSYGKYGHIDSVEVRLEAHQRVVDSIRQLDSFFNNAYQKLMGEDQDRTDDYDDSYMNSLVADAEELMPSEEFEEIDEPVRQMQESVQNFREAEKLEGPQPETWQAFQPQHQQIVENMEKMNASYQQQELAEVKQEARQRTAASIQQADSFFKDAYQKLMERDRIMQQEMAAMREQLEMMQRIMVNFSPDAMMKCMMAGTDYLREAEGARKSAQKEPTQAHRSFYQAARQSVHSVYQNIKEAPHRACESFQVAPLQQPADVHDGHPEEKRKDGMESSKPDTSDESDDPAVLEWLSGRKKKQDVHDGHPVTEKNEGDEYNGAGEET